MKNEEKISVIVPVFKVEQYLRQCVDSVINQTYSNLEILLVNDGSPDKCPEICEEYALKDKRIIVIHKENGGLASARNVGLDRASGSLISFVDSDDWIDARMYAEMIEQKTKSNAEIVCCEGIQTDGINYYDKCFHCKPTGTIVRGEDIAKDILVEKIGSQAVKGLYEKKCWENVRFPLGMLYEDIPTTYLAFENAISVSYVDEPFYKYRINPESISGSPNPLKSYHLFLGFKSHYEYAKLYYPEISRECCAKASHYGISSLLHCYTDAQKELTPYSSEIKVFLKDHRREIEYKCIPKSRAFALKLFYVSEYMFSFVAKCFYRSGLQEKMGFGIK